MLKGDIIEKISAAMPDVLKKDITQSIDIIIDTMNKALASGRRVEIRGFGSFSIRQRLPKITKNPKTGAEMNIPQRNTMHFTMSKSLKYPLIDSTNQDEKP
ncbi:MAG: integration host factor subunit beta [Proteobacteria bacterium]|nr:integration host factor subunit beta [Desulfobulbaceae bacterium]MBU4153167.1 integration host factor subunit beta [Pseudomonadota bacterium]MDP2107186.1 HU family DNA-binding protein [Desulfobulbaceae bacterium]